MGTQKSNVIQIHVIESSSIHQANITRTLLKRLMVANNHRMCDLAERSGLSLMLIARFLSGKIKILSARNLEKIARCYGLSSDALKGRELIDHLP